MSSRAPCLASGVWWVDGADAVFMDSFVMVEVSRFGMSYPLNDHHSNEANRRWWRRAQLLGDRASLYLYWWRQLPWTFTSQASVGQELMKADAGSTRSC